MHVLHNVQNEWGKYLHEDDLPQSLKVMVDHLKGKKEFYIDEYRLKLPDGNYKWFLSRGKISEYNKHGKPVRVSGSVTDITELKESEEKRLKLEQKMQQAQKLESLGILAGGIAHDFNNLLMGVIGNTDIMLYELPENSSLKNKLLDIKKAAKRASELTNQMLAYSGRGSFIVEPININELVQEMSSFLESSISKKVDLIYVFHKNLPPVKGDATQIRQVVMNLIVNASESIGNESGKIQVITDIAEIDKSLIDNLAVNNGIEPGRYLSLEITDTGCGIEETKMKLIFDPFYTTKFTGRGLGLAAVLGIIRSHKGALNLKSKINEGTTFKLFLPISDSDKKAEPAPADSSTSVNGEKLNILVIDDEDYIRKLTTRMLKIAGHTSFTAGDGKAGIEIFRNTNKELSCVILDLTMPDIDGEDVLKELKKINPLVPVVISSGYSPDDITKRFRDNEIAGFLQKPYQLSELLEAVAKSIIQ
jgi:signal transduction histidine kinase/CheY-like chemotaxis protein